MFDTLITSYCINISTLQDQHVWFFSCPSRRQSPRCPTSPGFHSFINTSRKQPSKWMNLNNKNFILYWGISMKLDIHEVKVSFMSAVSLFFYPRFLKNHAQTYFVLSSQFDTEMEFNCGTYNTCFWTTQNTSYIKPHSLAISAAYRSFTSSGYVILGRAKGRNMYRNERGNSPFK